MDRFPDVQRSTGCSEPAAVALAAALAARAARGAPRRIEVGCDQATHRNGLGAGVPGAQRAGLDLAAALGALAGDPERRLDVLAGLGPAHLRAAEALLARGAVEVSSRPAEGLWIHVRVTSPAGVGEALLEGGHTRVAALARDGVPLPPPAWSADASHGAPPPASLAEALDLAEALGPADAERLLEGLALNLAAAGAPAGAGSAPAGAAELAGSLAAAGSFARMTGRPVAVATSGWSGNQGFVAALPLHAVGAVVGAPRGELARALATSHLVGRLLREAAPSPLCHALIAASAGAAAGCARLLGGDRAAQERACQLVIASSGAPACDGAKPACSLRVGLGAAQAVRCATRAVAGPLPGLSGGLVGETLEETARRIAVEARRLALVVPPRRPESRRVTPAVTAGDGV